MSHPFIFKIFCVMYPMVPIVLKYKKTVLEKIYSFIYLFINLSSDVLLSWLNWPSPEHRPAAIRMEFPTSWAQIKIENLD